MEFNTSPDAPVEVRVGTSLISIDQAEQNLKTETDGGFTAVQSRAQKIWNDNLGRIEIEAPDDQLKTFYSCLYRAQLFPHRLYELDGSGKAVHYSPDVYKRQVRGRIISSGARKPRPTPWPDAVTAIRANPWA